MSQRWLFTVDLLSARRLAEPRRISNPRPAGVMRPGSTTEAVWAYLQGRPGVWCTRNRIVAAVGRTDKAVDWALRFLRLTERIEASHDGCRNPQYLRYRAPKGHAVVTRDAGKGLP